MFDKLRIGTLVAVGFTVALAASLLIAVAAWRGLGRVEHGVGALSDIALPNVTALAKVDEAHTAVMRDLNALMIPDLPRDLRARRHHDLKDAIDRFAAGRKEAEALPCRPQTLEAWKRVAAAADPWIAAVRALVNRIVERDRLLDGGAKVDDAEMQMASAKLRNLYIALQRLSLPVDDAFPLVRQAMSQESDAQAGDAKAASRAAKATLVAVLAIACALAVGLAVVLTRSVNGSIRGLAREADKLRDAVAKGRLGVRGDAARVHFQFRPVVDGVNATMDAYARPIAVASDCLTRISRGEIPPPITERAEGDFERINEALNGCIASLSGLLAAMGRMEQEQVAGELEAYLAEDQFHGAYRTMAAGVNAGVRMHVQNILGILEILGAYAHGDFEPRLRPLPGKQVVANQKMDLLRDNLKTVVEEARALSAAAVAGRLSARADAARFRGDWKALLDGVNATLDAVIKPLEVSAEYVERISRGEIPPPIAEAYAGDFGKIRDNLNRCIAAVNGLVDDVNHLVQAAETGKLSTRADARKHQGDFRKIVDGVNRTLDAVMAPIQESAQALERLSQRDLTARVNGHFQGDHARIKDSVNATAAALHEALAQVAQAVDQVSSAAAQIAASSQAVASGASEQASSLQETTASVDSVASMTKRSADHAQQAKQLAATARTAATEGAASMDRMQAAMGKIKASAEGTSQIIRDINDIAFQTNLLALNAAVEAARAGEAGRGFAVVAEEVRSLALRAKEAATKTEDLIRQSVKEANEGEVTAKDVAGKLSEITGSVGKVTDIVSEIAAAAREQTTGIEQVNGAVGEMDRVTQQNAASAEESSSAASELSAQAEELAAMVGAFRLSRQEAHAAGTAKPAARPAVLPASPANGACADGQHARAERASPMDREELGADF
jgi:methyl-accepting chemotaxis protein